MLKLTLNSGIVVIGEIAKAQANTEVPSITLLVETPKLVKEYKYKVTYTLTEKQFNGVNRIEYKSNEYVEHRSRDFTYATVFVSTIKKQEEI